MVRNPNCIKRTFIDTLFAADAINFVNKSKRPLFLLFEHDSHAQVVKNSVVGANRCASAAINAQIGVDIVQALSPTVNSVGGTAFYAGGTAGTILYNDVSHTRSLGTGRDSVNDVRHF